MKDEKNKGKPLNHLIFALFATIPAILAIPATGFYYAGNPDTALGLMIVGPFLVLGSPLFMSIMCGSILEDKTFNLGTCIHICGLMNFLANIVIMIRVPPMIPLMIPALVVSMFTLWFLCRRIERKHYGNEKNGKK